MRYIIVSIFSMNIIICEQVERVQHQNGENRLIVYVIASLEFPLYGIFAVSGVFGLCSNRFRINITRVCIQISIRVEARNGNNEHQIS